MDKAYKLSKKFIEKEKVGKNLDINKIESQKKKLPGYWQRYENVENVLKKIIEIEFVNKKGKLIKKAGEFPTEIQLREMKQRGILNAMQRYHDGLSEVRKKMRYESNRHPPGHWTKWENVENAMKKIIEIEYRNKKGKLIKKADVFPTQKQLHKINETVLSGAIQKHHGGLLEVKKKLGYKLINHHPRYWKKWENVENTMKKIIETEYRDKKGELIKKAGGFPTQSQLRTIKQGSVLSGMQRDYGGLSEVRKKMGYENIQHPSGYWKKWENFEIKLNIIINNEYKNDKGEMIKKAGDFPTTSNLREINQGIIIAVAQKYYGGLNNVRQIMDYPHENLSERSAYYSRRGYATERAVIELMKDWMDLNGFSYSKDKQTKVAPGKQLEFVCGKNKNIGIDVTNSKTLGSVEGKWNVKEYHKYVDLLWVIVVSNKFNKKQFKKWNEESPNNVIVIDYRNLESFLNSMNSGEINFNIPYKKKLQLESLAKCTYENHEKIRKEYEKNKNQKRIDYFFDN